jgi:hypothetical protein
MSGHTPGPWAVHDGGRFGEWGDSGPSICAETGPNRCQPMFVLQGPADLGQCRANAALVAAAPDLLACLKAAAQDFAIMRYGKRMPEWDAAIAKAEGR